MIQGEVAGTVLEMTKAQKAYNMDEGQAHEARIKHKEAEDKYEIFYSVSYTVKPRKFKLVFFEILASSKKIFGSQ